MRLLQTLDARLRNRQRLTERAEQIAASSFAQVWERVQRQIFELESHEARGYVRARARVVIERAIDSTARELGSSAAAKLQVLTLDRVIRQATTHAHAAASRQIGRRAA